MSPESGQPDLSGGHELLTSKETAERLRFSVRGLYALRRRGDGPPAIRVGSELRFERAGLDEWLRARRE